MSIRMELCVGIHKRVLFFSFGWVQIWIFIRICEKSHSNEYYLKEFESDSHSYRRWRQWVIKILIRKDKTDWLLKGLVGKTA